MFAVFHPMIRYSASSCRLEIAAAMQKTPEFQHLDASGIKFANSDIEAL